jgi:hypothetical protein
MDLIARAAGPRLEQIGFFNQVFLVHRRVVEGSDVMEERPRGWSRVARLGEEPEDADTLRIHDVQEETTLELWRKGGMMVPEIFQVWRI